VRPGGILEDRHDDVVREAVARREVHELAVGEAADASAEGPDPQRPAAVLVEEKIPLVGARPSPCRR
jgi:hypothetical protein